MNQQIEKSYPSAMQKRRAGVLLHITSLPGMSDNGDFGHEAYRFIEFISACDFTVWQVLPINPTHKDGSPYQCLSVHAGNPLLISLDWLIEKGWLSPDMIANSKYDRLSCLRAAAEKFYQHTNKNIHKDLQIFIENKAHWLEDYALFIALRNEQHGTNWLDWPEDLRDRDERSLQQARVRLRNEIDYVYFEQYIFFKQWQSLKEYADAHDILLFGDMPLFVAHDSADVWAHRHYFRLDKKGHSIEVAGVPPDYFSKTGQRWGNPLYHWDVMQADGFQWWKQRMQTQLELFDLVRIDHFRGLEAYWKIPAECKTAVEGEWIKAPGVALLNTLNKTFNELPLVAEDLGTITNAVDALRKQFNLPGMKIMQFAFDGNPDNSYLMHNHEKYSVVYTGTHDNNTTLGWFNSLEQHLQDHVYKYLGYPQEPMPYPLIRSAFSSVAQLAIVPMQDLLGLDATNRMNIPGTTSNNWQWRFNWQQVNNDLASNTAELVRLYGR